MDVIYVYRRSQWLVIPLELRSPEAITALAGTLSLTALKDQVVSVGDPIGSVSPGTLSETAFDPAFLAEFAREPDEFLGLVLGPFTMGQLLCIPMVAAGIWLVAAGRGKSAMAAETRGKPRRA